jgi:hypothetical protein
MTENVEKIRELAHKDRRRTIKELADTTGISYEVFQEILNRKFEHAPHCREVCSPTLDERSKAAACVLSYKRRLMRTQLLSLGSQRVMKVGFTVMIQKHSNNCNSGRAHNHQAQKRRSRSGVQQKHAHCFFRCEGFTVNLFLLTLRSTPTFTATF